MDLSALLTPSSIAIVGASKNPEKLGAQIVHNLLKSGFAGRLYPVNNKETGLIQGLQTYPTLLDIPKTVELVIIAVPAAIVDSIIDHAITKNVKGIIVISAGFKETGKEGQDLEKKIAKKCLDAQIALVGPNCLGIINPSHKLNASFANVSESHLEKPPHKQAKIALISQSGAFGTATLDWADNHNVGFSLFVSLGNKSVVSENDFLAPSLYQDTNVVALYLEDFTNGHVFMQKAQELSKHKPVVLLKPGKSSAAQHAMKSHTGSLATDDDVVNAACEKAGVIRVYSSEELFHVMYLFNSYSTITSNNIAIITNAGGPGILATDHLEEQYLQLAPISHKGQQELARLLPRQANIHDPVDVLGDAKAERYHHALKVCIHEEKVDGIVVILTPQTTTEIEKTAQSIVQIKHITDKPIVCSFLGGTLVKEGQAVLNKHNIPNFTYPEQAIYAIGKLYEYSMIQELSNIKIPITIPRIPAKPKLLQYIHNAKQEKRMLYPEEAQEVLADTDITHAQWKYVTDAEHAITTADHLNTPVVMKLISKELIHKTEMKAVYTNLNTDQEIEEAYENLDDIRHAKALHDARILIQEQITGGIECFLGIKKDPSFGPVIVFGTGGVYTEIYRDTAQTIAPLTKKEAMVLIKRTKMYKILSGARNGHQYDLDFLTRVICQVANIALVIPDIQEIDLNPLIITQEHICVVDARIIVI